MTHPQPLDKDEEGLIKTTVAQAAPVLANLRNLALAQFRALVADGERVVLVDRDVLQLEPLTGLDLTRPLDKAEVKQVTDAMDTWGVTVWRDTGMNDEQHAQTHVTADGSLEDCEHVLERVLVIFQLAPTRGKPQPKVSPPDGKQTGSTRVRPLAPRSLKTWRSRRVDEGDRHQ